MTCNTRPTHIDCACGTRVKVHPVGSVPIRCSKCSGKRKGGRPTVIQCLSCGKPVDVGPIGPVPMYGECCRETVRQKQDADSKRARKANPDAPAHVRPREDERELGPERPLLGRTPAEQAEWRDRRIVELYRVEEEMTVAALAERFDVSIHWVFRLLNQAGIKVQGTGRGTGIAMMLPPGLPVG